MRAKNDGSYCELTAVLHDINPYSAACYVGYVRFVYIWSIVALGSTLFYCAMSFGIVGFDIVWLGFLLAALAPLINLRWPYDNGWLMRSLR